ncbi:hypothetical protein PR048_025734 [Dryococelus australis]|uniref:Uncharacterized protein n=1 Tax=Dryococelus australis TaxID=614101 RepID=A0ABQ9GJC6_9NEOP|nr:hypothetical protein PR048_025734 [Dryococelus australis]
MQGRGKREILEKTRRLAALSGTTLTPCENPEATPPGIERSSHWCSAKTANRLCDKKAELTCRDGSFVVGDPIPLLGERVSGMSLKSDWLLRLAKHSLLVGLSAGARPVSAAILLARQQVGCLAAVVGGLALMHIHALRTQTGNSLESISRPLRTVVILHLISYLGEILHTTAHATGISLPLMARKGRLMAVLSPYFHMWEMWRDIAADRWVFTSTPFFPTIVPSRCSIFNSLRPQEESRTPKVWSKASTCLRLPPVSLSCFCDWNKCVSEEFRGALNIEVLRADEGENAAARNARAEETGDPRENPPTSGLVRHDYHLQKSGQGLNLVRLGGRRAG